MPVGIYCRQIAIKSRDRWPRLDSSACIIFSSFLFKRLSHTSLPFTHTTPLKADNIRFGHQVGKLDWIDKRSIQSLQIIFGHPTGDRTGTSNIHRNIPLYHFIYQLSKRWKANAVDTLCNLFFARYAASPIRAILTSLLAPKAPIAVMKAAVLFVWSSVTCVVTANIFPIFRSFLCYLWQTLALNERNRIDMMQGPRCIHSGLTWHITSLS